jgi:hypothetical protein
MGVTTLAILFFTGLLFCWSVALICPPSANRALPGRLFLVGSWLTLGALCLWLSMYSWGGSGNHGPVGMWMAGSVIMFCIQFLISVNERDSWGPRVARTIPRNRLLRLPALLFYSGAAGGVLLSVLGAVLALLTSFFWQELHPGFGFTGQSNEMREVFTALALYTFCYGMTAVVLRSYLLWAKIRPEFTWVLVLLLVGLGSSVPWIAVFVLSSGQMGRMSVPWYLLPNPLGGIYEIAWTRYGGYHGSFTEICFVFLGVWAVVLVVLSIPWAARQVERFRPSPRQVQGKPAGEPKEPVTVEPIQAG